ncbi:EscU/YscU/HrcU family type III secretion system export apparatus switch protein [Fulvimonas yonginensis]|uniref:EscU/YscU/HrcU family type III secretion system export apparatus switch protein n=1 Tax=Fulvimonas yonginensis TaxID=1495200 RepID=A0ABU8JD27_9GAMM
MSESEQSKTEQPTPFRLQEARKRGQVPRSAEFGGTLILLAFSVTLVVTSARLASALAAALRDCLQLAGNAPVAGGGLAHWIAGAFAPVGQALIPLVLAVVVVAVAGNVLQTGFVFSTHPLKPDFTRMNPAQALKRLFGMRTLWDLAKLSFKVGALALLAWYALGKLTLMVGSMALASPVQLPRLTLAVFSRVATWLLAVMVLLAIADVLFSRREYVRKLRMSRRDIKDETKRHEGDPSIRAKRRRLAAELLKRTRAIGRVAEADVVMTNPTHLAVALRYRPRTMRAPVVLAKGSDRVAARMRKLAERHGVPMLRSPELARALFRECGIDEPVPAELFGQLAPVYRWLMARPGNRIRT